MFKPTAYCGSITPLVNNNLNVYKEEGKGTEKGTEKGKRSLFKINTQWKAKQGNLITIKLSGSDIETMAEMNVAGSSMIGSQSSLANPSMMLSYLDPPFEQFTVDEYTFTGHLNDPKIRRDGCSLGATSVSDCYNSNNYSAGHTPLHEFGHALGLYHEHQNNLNNSNPIEFTQEFIDMNLNSADVTSENTGYCYNNKCYKKNSESASFISNVLDRYSDTSSFTGTNFDPYSVMLYAFPQKYLKSGTTYTNYKYSDLDLEILKKMYPKNTPIEIEVKFVDSANQEPWKKYWIKWLVENNIENNTGIKFNFSDIGEGFTGKEDNTKDTTSPTISLDPNTINIIMIVGIIVGSIIIISIIVWIMRIIFKNKVKTYGR